MAARPRVTKMGTGGQGVPAAKSEILRSDWSVVSCSSAKLVMSVRGYMMLYDAI